MSEKEILTTLKGKWHGVCRTWFEPGTLADESDVNGEFSFVLDGLPGYSVIHHYGVTYFDKIRKHFKTEIQ